MNGAVWDAKWRDEILTILDTAELGGDALTEPEAVERAEEVFDGSYDAAYGSFDLKTGEWTVRFYRKEQEAGRVKVDVAGEAALLP